jgi:hypothetical protein
MRICDGRLAKLLLGIFRLMMTDRSQSSMLLDKLTGAGETTLPLTLCQASTYPGANTNPHESDVYLAIRNVC